MLLKHWKFSKQKQHSDTSNVINEKNLLPQAFDLPCSLLCSVHLTCVFPPFTKIVLQKIFSLSLYTQFNQKSVQRSFTPITVLNYFKERVRENLHQKCMKASLKMMRLLLPRSPRASPSRSWSWTSSTTDNNEKEAVAGVESKEEEDTEEDEIIQGLSNFTLDPQVEDEYTSKGPIFRWQNRFCLI